MKRLREILAMPPEPLEMLGGIGAILWAVAWGLWLDHPELVARGPAYRDLAGLPPLVQAMLVTVATIGGVMQIAAAWINEARSRFGSAVAMAVLFILIAMFVAWRVGFSPTTACYAVVASMDVAAALMLALSGYVRP